jgi:hypothetical protein
MSNRPDPLTDDVITHFLQTRSADPDVGLLDDIVRTVGATPQDRPWLGLRPIQLPPRTLLLVAIGLLLATMGAIAVGTRLLPPDPVPAPHWPAVRQVIDALNSRDIATLRSTFTTDAIVVLPHLSSDGLQEVAASEFSVSTDGFLRAWMYPIDAWEMEADLGSCREEPESTFRCDVTTRWQVLQVEIGEEWTFDFDARELTRLQMTRVDSNLTNRTLPLGYTDLYSWEAWLEEIHPKEAARLLSGHALIWHFYFRYQHSEAEAIGASIREYLDSQPPQLQR